ncbi:MAG: ABC transporter permease [Chloroflexota bacterium]
MMIAQLLHSEWPKQRRTFTPWLLLIGPGTLALLATLPILIRPDARHWPQYLAYAAQMWSMVWVPFGGALLAGLAVLPETRGGAWRALRARPVPPAGLYLAKLAVLIGEGALASALMAALVLAGGVLVIGTGEPVRWDMLAAATLLPFAGAWALLALHLWLATAKGFAPTFTVAVGGFMTAMALSANPLGLLSPWTYPLRALSAMVAGDQGPTVLWAQALPIVGLSLALALALAILGAVWFARSEVK